MPATHAWAFRGGLRRNAFGWSGTGKAIERLNEAVGEIERVARTDPALAAAHGLHAGADAGNWCL